MHTHIHSFIYTRIQVVHTHILAYIYIYILWQNGYTLLLPIFSHTLGNLLPFLSEGDIGVMDEDD